MSGQLAAGDQVLLVDSKARRHLVTLAAGGELHLHTGVLRHDDLIGQDEGVTVRTTLGARLVAIRPTLSSTSSRCPAVRRSSIRRTSGRS